MVDTVSSVLFRNPSRSDASRYNKRQPEHSSSRVKVENCTHQSIPLDQTGEQR